MSCCSSSETFGVDYCDLRITNSSSKTMMFRNVVYVRGGAVNPGWPTGIPNDDQAIVRSAGFLAGVSGYVTYQLDGTDITIAFSSPTIGSNKLNVGTVGKRVWDEMDSKNYEPWAKRITTENGITLNVKMLCSKGPVNNAAVQIFFAR